MSEKTQVNIDVLWGAKAVGDALGCDHQKANRLMKNGTIPARKLGRTWAVTRSDLERSLSLPDKPLRLRG